MRFVVHKGVKGTAGDDVTIKRQFSGDIYLICSKKSQSDNLLKCVLFGNVAPVVVIQHKSLNVSKGVNRNWELARTDPDQIKKSLKFGHVTSKCKHNKTCARCSETGHKDDSCTKAFKCANCGECHTAYSKKCCIYKREYDIQSIKVSKIFPFLKLVPYIRKLMDRG